MGLFGRIFSKEACIVCGETVGSLKRKRLGDEAIICKQCAQGLSPWFDAFGDSSTDSIKSQLAAREQNRDRLPGFRVSHAFGAGDALLVDQSQGLFCVVPGQGGRSFSDGSQLLDVNPDLIPVSAITDIDLEDIGLGYREVKQTVDGEQVSYDPPRYEYPCNVRLHLKLQHPYLSGIAADISDGTINIQTEGKRLRDTDVLRARSLGEATADWLMGVDRRVEDKAAVYTDRSLEGHMDRAYKHLFGDVRNDHPDYAFGFKCSYENWPRIQTFTGYVEQAETARALLLKLRDCS